MDCRGVSNFLALGWKNEEMGNKRSSTQQSSTSSRVEPVVLGKRRRGEFDEEKNQVYKKSRVETKKRRYEAVGESRDSKRPKLEAALPSPLDIVVNSGDGDLIGSCFSRLINADKGDLLLGYLSRCTRQNTPISLSIERSNPTLCSLLRALQSKFPNLVRLSLEVSYYPIKQVLECCLELNDLALDCHFTDPEEFVDILFPPKLSNICLEHAVISDAVFEKLASISHLQRLLIHSSRFDFSHVPFQNTLSIGLLELSDPDINDRALEKLVDGCQELQFLEMNFCPTSSPEVFARLAYSSKMQVIRMRNVPINDQGIVQIQRRCPSLQWLCLNECSSVCLLDIEKRDCSELKIVKLSGVSINEKSVENLRVWSSNLRILKLQKCSSSLIFQLEQFTKLYALNLSKSVIQKWNILGLLRSCPDFTKLVLSECHCIGFNEAVFPIQNRLETLELSDVTICNRDLENMLQLFPMLKTLSLYECSLLDYRTLGQMRFPIGLMHLNLSEISSDYVDTIKKRHPNVEVTMREDSLLSNVFEEMEHLHI